VTGADTLSIEPGVGAVSGSSGSVTVSPTATTTYTLTATNNTGSARNMVVVAVQSAPQDKPSISSFTANPPTIASGHTTTLSWSGVTGADTLHIDPDVGSVSGSSGSVTVSPTATTTYTLTATNDAGSTTALISLTVTGLGAYFSYNEYPALFLDIYIPDGVYRVRPLVGLYVLGGFGGGGSFREHEERPDLVAWCAEHGFGLVEVRPWFQSGEGWGDPDSWLDDLAETAALPGLADHPEVAHAPLFVNGFSEAGYTWYWYAKNHPERIIAFSWNSGHPFYGGDPDVPVRPIYTGFLDPPTEAELKMPGIFAIGDLDSQIRINTLTRVFNAGREQGAPWTFLFEPNVGHQVVAMPTVDTAYLEAIYPLRIPPDTYATDGPIELMDIDLNNGYAGKYHTDEAPDFPIMPYEDYTGNPIDVSWLVNQSFAELWQQVAKGEIP
jgi:hypothetical protein